MALPPFFARIAVTLVEEKKHSTPAGDILRVAQIDDLVAGLGSASKARRQKRAGNPV